MIDQIAIFILCAAVILSLIIDFLNQRQQNKEWRQFLLDQSKKDAEMVYKFTEIKTIIKPEVDKKSKGKKC